MVEEVADLARERILSGEGAVGRAVPRARTMPNAAARGSGGEQSMAETLFLP
jgi:hypothetical protein